MCHKLSFSSSTRYAAQDSEDSQSRRHHVCLAQEVARCWLASSRTRLDEKLDDGCPVVGAIDCIAAEGVMAVHIVLDGQRFSMHVSRFVF